MPVPFNNPTELKEDRCRPFLDIITTIINDKLVGARGFEPPLS